MPAEGLVVLPPTPGDSSEHITKLIGWCLRKRKYSHRKADFVARKLRQELGSDHHPYRCPFCSRWHVGSRSKYEEGHGDDQAEAQGEV